MASVFLSYDHDDSALARPIAIALEKAGHSVWFDRHIHGGAQYSRKIEEALDEADAVVVLWSPRSLESAWVRDEAAEGRDRGKLVPLRVGGVSPPMGFRQFQTINLGEWKGRGKVPRFEELLEAVTNQAQEIRKTPAKVPTIAAPDPVAGGSRRNWIIAGLAVLLIAAVGFGAWKWLGRRTLPVVEVTAANPSARSQASANDLFVKLGSFAQVGGGKWKLVDAASAPARPDFVFRTADVGSPGQPQANLVLLDGKDDSLLWSREFSFPAGGDADLRQQLSLTAGRVLSCALESREALGLRRDLLKQFLNVCAILAETSVEEPETIARPLRAIVDSNPDFQPAWGRLLSADMTLLDLAGTEGDRTDALRNLKSDMDRAERRFPDLPELAAAKARFLPQTDYRKILDLFAGAIERAPDNAQILAEQAMELQRVGRMYDGVQFSARAAQVDPLSPTATTNLIMSRAYAGQLDEARKELQRAERIWAGTGALRDALWAFHFRYGDPATAKKYAAYQFEGLDRYLLARADPSAANIASLATYVNQFETRPVGPIDWAGAVQALGEFNRNDDVFRWLSRIPANSIAQDSYILFRPGLAGARRDPRFMALAKRIGLTDYWRSAGIWPDFCNDPSLPYDCKAEAAKYAN
jgi:tetratricopeptide (TPR) repeat protein